MSQSLSMAQPDESRAVAPLLEGDVEVAAVEERVLMLAETRREAVLLSELLRQAGAEPYLCGCFDELVGQVARGAGLLLIGAAHLDEAALDLLGEVLARQADWSDLQTVVLTGRNEVDAPPRELRRFEESGNVTVLERPVHRSSLASVVRTALRSRRRQYQTRALLRRLAEIDRKKDEFLAMLGHELRNPLAAISGATHLLEPPCDARVERALPIMRRQVANLSRIVDDLLEVSRMLSGRIHLRRQEMDLVEQAARTVALAQEAAQRRGLRLEASLPSQPVLVHADPVRIDQVITNILNNALKYTPSGGRIRVDIVDAPEWAVLRVSDTGVGIEPCKLEQIFEPFTQVDASIHRSEGGLGLGLPLVARLVELHGGTALARSEGRGRGATIEVRLPRSKRREASPLEAVPEAVAPGKGRLLVVEDNEDLRDVMCELLTEWGYAVEQEGTGTAALEHILRDPPEVALVDIGLPGIDGYELARRIRDSLPPDQISLIAITGYGQVNDRHRALAAGFDAHLVKPIDVDELSTVLGKLQAH